MQRLYPENTFVPAQLGNSTRLAVGEAPGEDEQLHGKPFIGGAGRWLDNMYKKAGVRKDDLTIINVMNCRPPDNIFPTDPDARKYISRDEGERSVAHCVREHVLPLLTSRQWSRIDLFGEKALRWLTGKVEGIYKWRASPLIVDSDEVALRVGAILDPKQ